MINDCLQNIQFKDNSILEKEYHLLYRKLSKKFEGDNLFFEIKNRLLRKGFNINEINEITKKVID